LEACPRADEEAIAAQPAADDTVPNAAFVPKGSVGAAACRQGRAPILSVHTSRDERPAIADAVTPSPTKGANETASSHASETMAIRKKEMKNGSEVKWMSSFW
jgi:hypothetical protein